MVTAVDHRLGFVLFDLLDDGGVIDCAGGDPLVEDDGRLFGLLDKLLRKLGQSLAVVPLVVEDGDLLDLQFVDGELHLQTRLGVIGGDGPVEVGILAALRQVRIRRRRGDGDDFCFLVNAEGRLGRPAADMTDDGVHILGNELGRRIGGDFRLADVVLHQEFHLPAQDAPLGVDLLDDHLRGLDRRQSIGGEVPAVRPSHSQLDGIGGEKGSGQKCCQKHRTEKHEKRSTKIVVHKIPPLVRN